MLAALDPEIVVSRPLCKIPLWPRTRRRLLNRQQSFSFGCFVCRGTVATIGGACGWCHTAGPSPQTARKRRICHSMPHFGAVPGSHLAPTPPSHLRAWLPPPAIAGCRWLWDCGIGPREWAGSGDQYGAALLQQRRAPDQCVTQDNGSSKEPVLVGMEWLVSEHIKRDVHTQKTLAC